MPQPSTIPDDDTRVSRVLEMLRLEDGVSIAGSLGLLLTGLAFCLGAGLVFATAATFISYAAAGTSLIGWFGWFAVFLLVLAPLIVWMERKSRPDYLGDAAGAVDLAPSSRGEMELDLFRMKTAAIATLVTWGPRSVVDGFAGVRGRWTAHKQKAFARAARMVIDLAGMGSGVEVKEIMHPPENMPTFAAAVDWLEKNDWLGRASDGKRLWLSSTGQKKLAAKGLLRNEGPQRR